MVEREGMGKIVIERETERGQERAGDEGELRLYTRAGQRRALALPTPTNPPAGRVRASLPRERPSVETKLAFVSVPPLDCW